MSGIKTPQALQTEQDYHNDKSAEAYHLFLKGDCSPSAAGRSNAVTVRNKLESSGLNGMGGLGLGANATPHENTSMLSARQ